MNTIDREAKNEAARLMNLVLGCKVPEMSNKPAQGVGRYLAREIAKKIVDEKNYPDDYKQKVKTYLSIKWS